MRRLQGRSFFYTCTFFGPKEKARERERSVDFSDLCYCSFVYVLVSIVYLQTIAQCVATMFLFFREQNNNNTYAINHIFNYIIHRLQLQSIMQANKCRIEVIHTREKVFENQHSVAVLLLLLFSFNFSFEMNTVLCLQSISFYFLSSIRIARYFFFFYFCGNLSIWAHGI